MIKRIKSIRTVFLLSMTIMLLTTSPARADTDYYWYHVVWGDTLSELSETHHQSINTVTEINHIEDIDLIYAGSYLKFIQYTKERESPDTKENVKRTEYVAEKKLTHKSDRARNMVKENPYYISLLGGN